MLDNQNNSFSEYCHDDENIVEKKRTRKPFSEKEDQKLRRLVHKFGEVNAWKKIADKMKGRNVRQCRERWVNTLSEKVTRSKWTCDEDNLLLQKYEEFGPKWKKMESFFPGRIQYHIRNRFKTLTRLNQLNKSDGKTDFADDLLDESNEEIVKKMEHINSLKETKSNPYKNVITFVSLLDNQRKGEENDIFKNSIKFDDDFFEYDSYWSNFAF